MKEFSFKIINKLNERVVNFESMLNTKSNQIALSKELSLKLQTDLKKQKLKTFICICLTAMKKALQQRPLSSNTISKSKAVMEQISKRL